eukprot:SAG31_NODE_3067_length_4723_cov_8.835063_4_plen_125_part_00
MAFEQTDGFYWLTHSLSALTAQSTTSDGVTWSKLTYPSQLWGSSPQLVSMSNGVLALSAGGPGLALWLSRSEGAQWTQHNIACLSNSMQWNITLRFDGEMRRAISATTGDENGLDYQVMSFMSH